MIVDDGSNKFGSLHVESEVTSSLISKTTTISTTTSVKEDVYWSPCKSTDKPVISYKVEDLDPKDERDSKICNVVLRGNHYINKQERRTTFVGALKTHFDAHKSGDDGLSKKEVNAALKSFAKKDRTGKFPKLEELEALFGDMDLNGAGRVSYDELTDFIDDAVSALRRPASQGADGGDVQTGGDPSPPPAQPARPLPEKVKEWPTNFMKLLRDTTSESVQRYTLLASSTTV